LLHSCQLRRYMEVSCQFHTLADLPSGHSLTRRLRAPGSRPPHSGEHVPPIEPRFLWDRWPPYLTLPLSNKSYCYTKTTSNNEGSNFSMCDAVHSGKFYQIADELGASTFRVKYTEDRTSFRDLPISVPNHTASSQ
jgi:hypothetical protein